MTEPSPNPGDGDSPEVYQIVGGLGSPYSMKMRAIMRYRRLVHVWDADFPDEVLAKIRPPVIPKIRFPDGEWHVDSTPMIYELERRHRARSIVPPDPVHAYLAHLLEDTADEWLTKVMFHFRWWRTVDQEQCSRWLIYDRRPTLGADRIATIAAGIRDRQVGRMPMVGCTEQNLPVIEGTFYDVIGILNEHVTQDRFLFGSRPSMADFGWYGQLHPLAHDPTSQTLMRTHAPYTMRWVLQCDDLSGLSGEWRAPDAALPAGTLALLRLAAELYLPFLEANRAAYENDEDEVVLELRGHEFRQGTFRYQLKCYDELRKRLAMVGGEDRVRLDGILEEAGALRWLID